MKMKRLKIILQIMVVVEQVDLLLKVNNQQRLKPNLKTNLKMIWNKIIMIASSAIGKSKILMKIL
jgi:hypothetical protein